MELKPFVKWAGGKRQLLDHIVANLPKEYDRYFEPFLGGGAVLLHLQPTEAIVSDVNPELINAFEVIKDQPDALMKKISKMKNDEEFFYKVRKQKPAKLKPVDRAARFIYLNKTCFNGLYRENSRGEFNVPFAFHKNPTIAEPENIQNLHEYLTTQKVKLVSADYRQILLEAKAGDFVYIDSPYFPLKKGSFTKYAKNDFTLKDHQDLAEVYKALCDRGCKVLMSNSNTKFIKDLYKDFTIIPVPARRSINSKGNGRAKDLIEVLIKNY
jgi:DNA adenine methylase